MRQVRYQVMVIDPPWQQQKGGKRKVRPRQGKSFNYPTMPLENIFSLLDTEIFALADKMHCVFVWVIEKYLEVCNSQMQLRGYKRHCTMIWNKVNGIAPAFTVRLSHEYLVWYYKPKLLPVAKNFRGVFTTVFTEKSREHSRKPDYSYYMLDCLYPDLKKIDVFSREKRNGWDQYGDEIKYYQKENNK